MSTPTRAARTLALAALLCAALAACAPQANQPTTEAEAGETQLAVNQAYPEPGTATAAVPAQPTTAPAVSPTAAPTAPPAGPTAAPGAASLLGPEWTVAYSGDMNGDGRVDAIGWAVAAGVPRGPSFNQAQYASFVGPAAQVVIVHSAADGKPQAQFFGTVAQLAAGNTVLASFAAGRQPAGLMMRVTAGTPRVVELLQVNASGEPFAQAIGVRWDAASQAYRIAGAAGK